MGILIDIGIAKFSIAGSAQFNAYYYNFSLLLVTELNRSRAKAVVAYFSISTSKSIGIATI